MLGSVSEEAVGKAAGTNTVMRELGGVFGIAVAVAVFAAAGSYATPQTFIDGFGPAIGVAAAIALVGAIAGTFLPGHGEQDGADRRRHRQSLALETEVTGQGGKTMRRVIVRYRVKPERADENEASSARCMRSSTAAIRRASAI